MAPTPDESMLGGGFFFGLGGLDLEEASSSLIPFDIVDSSTATAIVTAGAGAGVVFSSAAFFSSAASFAFGPLLLSEPSSAAAAASVGDDGFGPSLLLEDLTGIADTTEDGIFLLAL